jgi:simple sugar transport system ATP-binding protein
MAEPLLEARGVTKHYGHVLALDGVNFTAYAGEVVALIGDNGAGKSTLVKTLSGTIRPDRGEIVIGGEPVRLASPLDARKHGIETVYQDLALAPDLDAAANLHLGREIYRIRFLGVLNRSAMRNHAIHAFSDLGVRLPDVSAPVAALSGGQRQSVAVARAVIYASRVIFMDEPTAALGVVQRERVLETIRRVRDRGISVVLISHNMPEVLAVADRVEVLRMGRRVAVYNAAQTSVEELVGAMTGALDVSGVSNRNIPNGASADAHPSPDASDSDQRGPDAGGPGGAAPDRTGPDRGSPDRGSPDRGSPDRGSPDTRPGDQDGSAP